jgi:hypothetical protein
VVGAVVGGAAVVAGALVVGTIVVGAAVAAGRAVVAGWAMVVGAAVDAGALVGAADEVVGAIVVDVAALADGTAVPEVPFGLVVVRAPVLPQATASTIRPAPSANPTTRRLNIGVSSWSNPVPAYGPVAPSVRSTRFADPIAPGPRLLPFPPRRWGSPKPPLPAADGSYRHPMTGSRRVGRAPRVAPSPGPPVPRSADARP